MKKQIRLFGFLSFALLTLCSHAFADLAPLALVWNGPGVCKPGCGSAAAKIAQRAGFRTYYIYPGLTDYSIFKEAKLWVQPGGVSRTAAQAMGPAMVDQVRQFVANGGGYVGFCAGGFLSTAMIGTSSVQGYGVTPGETELFIKTGSDHRMLNVSTRDGTRWVYYAGGPFFKITDEQLAAQQGEVIARYADGSIAGVEAHYGKGKVAVTGFHPEAGFLWKLIHFKIDRDGKDFQFAVDMVKYATSP
jgi:glutamine amidotransferase-like uncharacterized protein